MKNFFNTFLACLAAIVASGVLFFMVMMMMFAGVMAAFSTEEAVSVNHNTILKIELTEPVYDHPSQNLLSTLNPYSMTVTRSLSLLSILNAIEKAAEDPRIEGIYLNLSNLSVGMGAMEEIRSALAEFKESGKFIVSYSNYYSQGSYYLASVADKVYLNPEGELDWRGMASQNMFFKGTLDKLGIVPEIYRVGEFKSAVEPFINDKMSPENREQMEVLLNSIWGGMVADIAKSRSLKTTDLQQYASTLAVQDPQTAVELQMADAVMYYDEVLTELGNRVDAYEEPDFISLAEYITVPSQRKNRRLSRNKISVIYAEGDIVEGTETEGAVGGEGLARLLAKARQDDAVKAVVLRVNSPGGSALASELIWREMSLLQEKKPIIVSMGDYAASGGYWISAPADLILADRATLTGSIGVFGVAMDLSPALKNKLGVTVDVAKTNPSADYMTSMRSRTPQERAFIQRSVESVYEKFIDHVSNGRNLPEAEVRRIAGGRVWSGANADELGLVDGIGGLKDAIAIAADRAGVSTDYRVVTPESGMDQFSQLLNMLIKAKLPQGVAGEAELINEYRSLMRVMDQSGVQARMPYGIQIE